MNNTFRIGLKRENAIYKLRTEILNDMNNKVLVGGIFCDLEKAFDCADLNIPLSKLKFNTISGKDLALHDSYLDNRHIRTAIYNDSNNSNNSFKLGSSKTWSLTRLCFGTSTFSSIYK
jgi:hypothetical protein